MIKQLKLAWNKFIRIIYRMLVFDISTPINRNYVEELQKRMKQINELQDPTLEDITEFCSLQSEMCKLLFGLK